MANTLLTLEKITNESLMILENQLTLAKQINREYQDNFAQSGAKIGATLNIRKPTRYVGRTGANLNIEDTTETSVPLTISYQEGVDIEFSDAEMALDIDDYSKRYLTPAISLMANRVDTRVAQLFNQVSNAVGTPGTTPTSNMTYLQAGVALDNNAAPLDGQRKVVINPAMTASLANANLALFNPSQKIGEFFEKGAIGKNVLGFDFYMDQNIQPHTYCSATAGTPVVNGANQSGNTIVTNGWTPSTKVLFDGDIISFAGVNGVNPVGKQDLGALKQFSVKGDVTSDSSGNATITLWTPIIPAAGASITAPFGPSPVTVGSAHQNVTAAPAAGAAITSFNRGGVASPQGLAFHPDWATLACVDLPLAAGTDMAKRVRDKQLGLSIRAQRVYLPATDQRVLRLDILYGLAVMRGEWAVRING